MNKKGLELSINFIVLMIFATVTFIVGIWLITNIFSGTEELPTEVSKEVQDRVDKLLLAGKEAVIIPELFKTTEIGDTAMFSVGVRADQKCGSDNYHVEIGPAIHVNRHNTDITDDVSTQNWYFPASAEVTITHRARHVFALPIRPDGNADSGSIFSFDVYVFCQGNNNMPFGGKQRIFLRIE